MIPSIREKNVMDLSAIWNAITQNLATVSLVSVGGPLWAAIKWSHHRFNKKHRFKMLRGDAVDVVRAISFYQRSKVKSQDLDSRAFYTVETGDTLVEILRALQDSLRPLGVHLFSESELTTRWLTAGDKPLQDGRLSSELGKERIREIGLSVRLASRLMRKGHYRQAKQEFPSAYEGARIRYSNQIKSQRTEDTIRHLEVHGIKDSRPLLTAGSS